MQKHCDNMSDRQSFLLKLLFFFIPLLLKCVILVVLYIIYFLGFLTLRNYFVSLIEIV